MQHVYFVNDFDIATSLEKIIGILSNADFNPNEKAILEKTPSLPPSKEKASGEVKIIEYGKNHVSISSNLDKDSLVVISDSYYPGWKAKIDGKQTEILAANINSRAVVTPKGKHIIQYSYEPPRWHFALMLTIISSLSLLVLTIRFRGVKLKN